MPPSSSGNCGGWVGQARLAAGRQTHPRRRLETPSSPRALPGFSNTGVPGLIPAEPESCLDQERVFRSSVARVAVGQALNLILLDEFSAQFFLIGWGLIGHVEDLVPGANVSLGIAMTVDTPIHVQGVF